MISIIDLANAMAATLQKIPALVSELDQIVAYIDENPTRNSLAKAIYQMPAGSLLIAWQETVMETTDEEKESWVHRIQIYVRARRGASPLAIIDILVDGIPEPGDGLRWRYCPLIDGVLPTDINEIARFSDEEGIDYYVLTTATQETGDF